MIPTERFAQVEIGSAAALRDWLAEHHASSEGVWLVTFKKHMGERYLSRDAVLDALLSFGWIDGIRRKLDDDRTMQLITPRKTQGWTKTYRDRATRLIAEGCMAAPGLTAIETAKRAGTWEALPDVDALIVPDDLAAALTAAPPALARFAASPPAYRRNVLRWIAKARTAPTRQKRIGQTVEAARAGERVPQM